MIRRLYVLILLFVVDQFCVISPAAAALNCSNQIETTRLQDTKFFGKITIPNFNMTTDVLHVAATFAEHQIPINFNNSTSALHGPRFFVRTIVKGTITLLLIYFPDELRTPKLINLTLNGEDSCFDNEYPGENPNLEDELLTYKVIIRNGNATSIETRSASLKTPIPSVCGREGEDRSNFVPFVRKGTELKRGQFPWLVAINEKASGALSFLCCGSLISTRTVVTAAHCFKYPNTLLAHQIVVELGRHNLESYMENFESREIDKLHIHPDYDLISFPDADIALLQLALEVSYSQYIKPICLWNEPNDESLIVGENGVVAGWGGDESGRWFTNLPKIVNSNIVSEHDCRKSQEVFRVLTTSRTICAGNRDGSGPCMGDSGGGLMLKRNGRWQLRGIMSTGLTSGNECNLREYVVYCDIAKHMEWVQDNMLE